MRRFHIFEFEDQRWLPRSVRDGITDYLRFLGNISAAPYIRVSNELRAGLEATGETTIVDLCSGGAGPIPTILRIVRQDQEFKIRAVLTDLHPNIEAFEAIRKGSDGDVDFVEESINAAEVPEDLSGFRILCNSFHHFLPSTARMILEDAVRNARGIMIVEGIERTAASIMTCAASLLVVPLVTPFIRPFRWSRLLFTYVIPLIPFMAAWDGIVSSLRAYTIPELHQLTSGLGEGQYTWKAEKVPVRGSPTQFTFLIGYPSPLHETRRASEIRELRPSQEQSRRSTA